MRVLNAEPKGAAPAPKRWPSDRAKRRSCQTARRICKCAGRCFICVRGPRIRARVAYVAVSRGAYDAQIFTNDCEKLGGKIILRGLSPSSSPNQFHQRGWLRRTLARALLLRDMVVSGGASVLKHSLSETNCFDLSVLKDVVRIGSAIGIAEAGFMWTVVHVPVLNHTIRI